MNKLKGILLFYDWMEVLETLSAKDYKAIISAIYKYQMFGTPPPEFVGKAKTISAFIFPQIERRKHLSEYGMMGACARYKRTDEGDSEKASASDKANSQANGQANGRAYGVPMPIDKDRDKDRDKDKTESETEDAGKGIDARSEREGDGVKGQGYGKYGNVILSTEEYLALSREIPDLEKYIDRFSEKMHLKGYRYTSHFDALRQWWDRDKDLGGNAVCREPEPQGSFETDSFFEAAVRRSMGLSDNDPV
ncbi:MAG: hypothetical protein IJY39_08545 [Clostridia bacterium]|nr:hypothetical protein [Clostridia bacterium]